MKAAHTADSKTLGEFDKRVTAESKKAKDIATAMDKLQKNQDLYKKSEGTDLVKVLEG